VNKKLLLLSLLIFVVTCLVSFLLYSNPIEKISLSRYIEGKVLGGIPLQYQTSLAERLGVPSKIKTYYLHFENRTNINNSCSYLPGYVNFFRISVPKKSEFLPYADRNFEREVYPNRKGELIPLDIDDPDYQHYILKNGKIIEFDYPGDRPLSFQGNMSFEESGGPWQDCAIDVDKKKTLHDQGFIVYARVSLIDWLFNFFGILIFMILLASSVIGIWEWSRK
jgi:hypothetical protein